MLHAMQTDCLLKYIHAFFSPAETEPHEGKRKVESLWPIFRIHHQKTRYIFDLFYKRKAISRGKCDWLNTLAFKKLLLLCSYTCEGKCIPRIQCGGCGTIFRNWFSPFAVWAWGIELRSLGLYEKHSWPLRKLADLLYLNSFEIYIVVCKKAFNPSSLGGRGRWLSEFKAS